MTCELPKPVYVPHSRWGIAGVASQGDGYSIAIEWTQAYPSTNSYSILYNIYYSSNFKDVFTEGVKAVSIQDGYLTAIIPDLSPGDTYYFAVRAAQYPNSWFDPSELPTGFPDLKVYPEAALLADISETDIEIPISDLDQFPTSGVVQIGYELILYSSKNTINSSLVLSSVSDRGYANTNVTIHTTDGYDGSITHDPIVKFWNFFEETNKTILQASPLFTYPHFAWTAQDGYRVISTDDLNTDLSASDANNEDFPSYDGVGWHRTDPLALLQGECIGTYYGGERYCADGYGVGQQIRGVAFGDESSQRLEQLLKITGEPVVLLKRLYTGTTCSCMKSTAENPSLRCPICFGTGWVGGYEQYFNPRRSDGRIMVRFDATEEDIKYDDEGLESSFLPNCWTLVVPAVKSRDVLIRFNEDGTEEFRYEIQRVTRNKLIESLSGAQKFSLYRLRKTSPPYQWRAFRNTATQPQTLVSGIGFSDRVVPHTHNIVINENIISINQINHTTGISLDHSHPIINGVVQEVMGHTHDLIL